jgi:predicted GNAT family acetyltransferase
MSYDVRNNEQESRFETTVDGYTAIVAYDLEDPNRIVFTHTDVPKELAGRGIAQELVRTGLEHARAQKLTVVPQCAYVQSFLKRNPEFDDLTQPAS